MKNHITAIVTGITAIICVSIFTLGLITLKTAESDYISVTGSATKSFVSDLIVWRGSFAKKGPTIKEVYDRLQKDTQAVRNYLISNGVSEDSMVFSSIETMENYEHQYNNEGRIIKTTFSGYTLTQRVTIESAEVDKVEKISRNVTELIDQGVEFFSMSPEYYYTKLDELKLDLIAASAENSRMRAEAIAKQAGVR